MEPAPIDRSVGSAPDCLLAVRAAEAGRVLQLARAGCTYRDIGVRLGLSTTTAWRRHRWAVAALSSSEDVALPSTRGVRPPALRPVYVDGPDRELYRLHPRPARRCAARRKRGGMCGACRGCSRRPAIPDRPEPRARAREGFRRPLVLALQ